MLQPFGLRSLEDILIADRGSRQRTTDYVVQASLLGFCVVWLGHVFRYHKMTTAKKEMSRAKRRAAVEKALGGYQKQAADITNAEEIAKILRSESDRGIVVAYVSFIEDALVDQIVEKLGIPNEARRSLTKGSGALSNTTSVADLAVALGCFHPSEAETLSIMRMMRNACAHCRREINFGTPELRDALLLLFYGMPDVGPRLEALSREGIRELFIVMAGSLLDGITSDGADETHVLRAIEVIKRLRGPPASSPRKSLSQQTRRLS